MSNEPNKHDEAKVAEAVAYCKQKLGGTGKGRSLGANAASGMLYTFAAETQKFLSLTELQQAIFEVETYYNEVMVFGRHNTLTAGDLKRTLCDLPDNTPVLYQRIEDSYFAKPESGWKTILLLWGSHEIDPSRVHLYANVGPEAKIVDRDGKKILEEYSGYIPAWGSYVTKDENGRTAVCIHAHY